MPRVPSLASGRLLGSGKPTAFIRPAVVVTRVPDTPPSVRRRIERHRPQDRVSRTEPPQHRVPQPLGLVVEDILAPRRRDDPGLLFELRLELAGAPSGVAGEDTGPPDRAAGDPPG